jgi:benzil reductase ((S)-benzoin forming)
MALPDLTGRTALITGASRGIGAGLVCDFTARGMRVAGCARNRPNGCEISASVDVQDEAAVAGFIAEVTAAFGTIDLLIHNAGVLEPIAPTRDLASADFRHHIDINLVGTFHVAKHYARHVRGHGGTGVLLTMSSGAATKGYAGWAAYCAGKAGLDRLTETIQLEEADAGLRAHAVAPGVIDTDMQALIRSTDESRFPMRQKFVEMKAQEAFNTIPFVAQHLLHIAFDPTARPATVVLRLPAESG